MFCGPRGCLGLSHYRVTHKFLQVIDASYFRTDCYAVKISYLSTEKKSDSIILDKGPASLGPPNRGFVQRFVRLGVHCVHQHDSLCYFRSH